MNTINTENYKKPTFYKSIVTMTTISLFLALGVGIFQTNPGNYKGDITNPGSVTAEDYLGAWCGYSVVAGDNSSITTTQILCQDENPKNNCPAGFTSVHYAGLASANDNDYYTFFTCIYEDSDQSDIFDNSIGMWCGYHGINQGNQSSVTSATINCGTYDPQTACPTGYQQIVLKYINDEADTSTSSASDLVYSCLKTSNSASDYQNSWFGWAGIEGTTSDTCIDTNSETDDCVSEITIKLNDLSPQTGCDTGFKRISIINSDEGSVSPHKLYFCAETGTCGDGIKTGTEECDDGNTNNSDGCSASCEIESDWQCDNTDNDLSQCFNCGNGTIEAPEECDDSDNNNSDGCSASCEIEPTYECTTKNGTSDCSVLPFFELDTLEIDYKKQVVNINETIQDVQVTGIGKDWYDTCTYTFDDDDTGIDGEKDSEFEFDITNTATAIGEAELDITCTCNSSLSTSKCADHKTVSHSTTAKISVIAEDHDPLAVNLLQQTIYIGDEAADIVVEGGSGDYSFQFSNNGTGLSGAVDSDSDDTYNIKGEATSTGTAILTITDKNSEEVINVIIEVKQQTLSVDISSQTIGIKETPAAITVSGGSGDYSFSLDADTTGLSGKIDDSNDSKYVFTSTATSTGAATLTITDNKTDETITAAINVAETNLSVNLSTQTIGIHETPFAITASGGSGEYSFSLDASTTGLNGSGSSKTYNFTNSATSTGEATLTIIDDNTNETVDAVINVVVTSLSVNLSSQTVVVNHIPSNIIVSGGSGEYSFSLDASTTGLEGIASGNIYTFSEVASNTGTATLTITDTETNTSKSAKISVITDGLFVNLSSQTATIRKAPSNITVNGGSGSYSFSFDADTTGLTGTPNSNTYAFDNTATSTGTATLTITDTQTSTNVSATINIVATTLSINLSQQTVGLNKQPSDVVVSGGSGEYSFSLNAGGTGLEGTGSGNIYTFTKAATSTGTATLTITDTQTNISISAEIDIEEVVLTLENGGQSITIGSTPNPISVSGGSGSYTFTTNDNGTGLEGTASGNTFIFSGSASGNGIFTIQIFDTVNNVSKTTTVIVSSLSIVPNITSQAIAINQTPLSIKAYGGSGSYIFELSADEAMGISGSGSGDTFTFTSPALTTGTITITIYDTYDQENSAISKVTVYQTSPVINISEQSIFVGETPQSLIAYSSSNKYNFVFIEGNTRLSGERQNSSFVFTQPALREGTAVVNLTEEDMTSVTASSTVNVLSRPLTANISSQKISLGEDVDDIIISGGSGEYIMELSDPDGTGLRGYQNGNTFVFDTAPNSSGTVTLEITDYYDSGLTKEIAIVIEAISLSLNISNQTVDVNELPDDIIVSGGSGEYIFTFSPNETGLKGSAQGNTFSFTSAGDTAGEAILEIIDKNDESKAIITTITVNDSPLKSLSIDLLNCDYGKNLITGDVCTLIATGTYENGDTRDISEDVTWRGTESIGSVSSNILTISDAGTTTISAVKDGISSSANITITVLDADKLVSFEISTLNCSDTVMIDDVCTLSAVGTFENGDTAEVSDRVNWYGYSAIGSLSDRDLTITDDGSVTIKGSIVNSDDKEILCNNSISLTAIDKEELTDIEISSACTDNTVDVTDVCILTAIGTYADNSTRDISGQVEWLGTETVGTLSNYYLTITQEGTANIYATLDNEISNVISITSERALLDIIAITTTGNASAAKGTTDTLYIDIMNLYGIDDLKTVEISLVKGRYCSVSDIPSSAQVFNIVNDSASASYSFSNEILTLEVPIYIPLLSDLTNGKHTILVRVSSTAGVSSEVYPFNVGIPASGDVNYDGLYSLTDAILAMKFYSGSAEADATQLEAADFNDNGAVDLLDVIAVFRAVIDTQNGETVVFDDDCE